MNNLLKLIDTEKMSISLRQKSIDLTNKQILITNLKGTEQEKDLTEPANCDGFGRVRHFRLSTSDGWPKNPLPIQPACKSLNLPETDMLTAQVFQNAVCNWRCWYCYVPFNLLSADMSHSKWLTASKLVDLYLKEKNPPKIIDLSGGQPDIIPEWVPWMMRELRKRELENKVYLWSDDNLSTDYFWKYLTEEDIELIKNYKKYGKVCCFKGFDSESFSFNTMAEPQLFENQFELMKKLLKLGLDIYCYVTLTSPSSEGIEQKVSRFVDKLQDLSHFLPLRTIPLEIKVFNPVNSRLNPERNDSICNQNIAIKTWNEELSNRYSKDDLSLPITDIPLYQETG